MAVTEHPPPPPPPPVDEPELLELWEDAPGIPGFLSTVDHKRIAVLYMLTALVFFVIAGVEALFMRLSWQSLTTTFSPPTPLTNSLPCTARR